MMEPVLNIVTGSTSCAGLVTPKTPLPPFFTAPALLLPPLPLESLPELPQAARMAESAVAEMPSTLPRTSSCWRFIRPAFASS